MHLIYTKLAYQHFKNINLKLDHCTGHKWSIYGPRRHEENQLLILEHSSWLFLI